MSLFEVIVLFVGWIIWCDLAMDIKILKNKVKRLEKSRWDKL